MKSIRHALFLISTVGLIVVSCKKVDVVNSSIITTYEGWFVREDVHLTTYGPQVITDSLFESVTVRRWGLLGQADNEFLMITYKVPYDETYRTDSTTLTLDTVTTDQMVYESLDCINGSTELIRYRTIDSIYFRKSCSYPGVSYKSTFEGDEL